MKTCTTWNPNVLGSQPCLVRQLLIKGDHFKELKVFLPVVAASPIRQLTVAEKKNFVPRQQGRRTSWSTQTFRTSWCICTRAGSQCRPSQGHGSSVDLFCRLLICSAGEVEQRVVGSLGSRKLQEQLPADPMYQCSSCYCLLLRLFYSA